MIPAPPRPPAATDWMVVHALEMPAAVYFLAMISITYHFGDLATWLSAAATTTAAVTALWLARRPERERVLIRFALRDGRLTVRIANPTSMPVTVEQIGWRVGWRWPFSRPDLDLETLEANLITRPGIHTPTYPLRIDPHAVEELLFEFEYADPSGFAGRLKKKCAEAKPWSRRIVFTAELSNGRRAYAKLQTAIRREMCRKASA